MNREFAWERKLRSPGKAVDPNIVVGPARTPTKIKPILATSRHKMSNLFGPLSAGHSQSNQHPTLRSSQLQKLFSDLVNSELCPRFIIMIALLH